VSIGVWFVFVDLYRLLVFASKVFELWSEWEFASGFILEFGFGFLYLKENFNP
jgi:hypothetical protein